MIENKKLPLSHWLERLSLSPRGLLRLKMDAINKQRPITLRLLNEYQDELTADLYKALNDHLNGMDVREIACLTEDALKEIRNNESLTPKDRIRLTKETRDEHQVKMKAIQVDQAQNLDSPMDKLLSDIEVSADNNLGSYQSKYKNDPRVFRPHPIERVVVTDPIIELNGQHFLKKGRTAMMTATAGQGKSTICLAICSSVVNPGCDSFGFSVNAERIIYFDGEMDREQSDENFVKLINRCKVSGEKVAEKVRYIQTSRVDNISDRKDIILEEIKEFKPQIVIIDGGADLISDPNNSLETIELKSFLRHITDTYKLGIVLTIHSNPNTDRSQGHLGTKLFQEVETSVLIKKDPSGIGIVTSNFGMGKKRKDAHIPLETFYCYDYEKRELVSCEDPRNLPGRPKRTSLLELDDIEFKKMGEKLKGLAVYSDHITRLTEYCKKNYPNRPNGETAIVKLHKFLKEQNLIKVIGNGKETKWRFIIDEDAIEQMNLI